MKRLSGILGTIRMPHPSPRPPIYTLVVKKSATGYGLFAGQAIPAHRFLIEYWGPIVSDDEANRVRGRYLFEIGKNKTILGGLRNNIARYANHACRPNAEARIIKGRVFLFSKKAIHEGDEITYNYGKEYVDAFIKPHGCRCASCQKKRATSFQPPHG